MTSTSPAAGWYADPTGGTALRYWNGAVWTDDTQPAPLIAGYTGAPSGHSTGSPGYPAGASGYPAGASGYPAGATGYPAGATGYPVDPGGYPAAGFAAGHPGNPGAGGRPQANRPAAGFAARNKFFLITAAICGVYALIATFSNFAFFGILPALYTFRSFQAKEPLAVVALGVAVVTIFFSLNHIYG